MPSRIQNQIKRYGTIRIDEVLNNPDNWRQHPRTQVESMTAAFYEVGIVQNILINEQTGHMIDGHMRVLIYDREGLEEAPATFIDVDLETERKILATYDPLGDLAGRDADVLAELAESTRFDSPMLDELMRAQLGEALKQNKKDNYAVDPDEDERKEEQIDVRVALAAKWKTEPGQLWTIPSRRANGLAHRLYCGDATDEQSVYRLLGGPIRGGWGPDSDRPLLMATDPPYGVDYDSEWRAKYSTGEYQVGKVQGDLRADWGPVWNLWQPDVLYVWHSAIMAGDVWLSMTRNGYDVRSQIIWDKTVPVFGRGHYHFQHESAWYGVRDGATANWTGPHNETTMWRVANLSGAGRPEDPLDLFNGLHVSQKPVELYRRPIRNHTRPRETFSDPFAGSGSCLVAAEDTGRVCYAMELDPEYVAVCLERLAEMGLQPERS